MTLIRKETFLLVTLSMIGMHSSGSHEKKITMLQSGSHEIIGGSSLIIAWNSSWLTLTWKTQLGHWIRHMRNKVCPVTTASYCLIGSMTFRGIYRLVNLLWLIFSCLFSLVLLLPNPCCEAKKNTLFSVEKISSTEPSGSKCNQIAI